MNINMDSFITKLNSENIEIIDIRDEYEYSKGHINNSINIPVNFLLNQPSYYLDKSKKYYIYCQHGNTSKRAVKILNSMGFKTISVNGGYSTYLLWK